MMFDLAEAQAAEEHLEKDRRLRREAESGERFAADDVRSKIFTLKHRLVRIRFKSRNVTGRQHTLFLEEGKEHWQTSHHIAPPSYGFVVDYGVQTRDGHTDSRFEGCEGGYIDLATEFERKTWRIFIQDLEALEIIELRQLLGE